MCAIDDDRNGIIMPASSPVLNISYVVCGIIKDNLGGKARLIAGLAIAADACCNGIGDTMRLLYRLQALTRLMILSLRTYRERACRLRRRA